MNDSSDNLIPPADTALQVARALLDGASRDWVAKRFDLSAESVEAAWGYVVSVLMEHYRNRDVPIEDFDSFAAAHMQEVLDLLLTWSQRLSMPTIDSDPDEPLSPDEKKGTGPEKRGG